MNERLRANPDDATCRDVAEQLLDNREGFETLLRDPSLELRVRLYVAGQLIELRRNDRTHVRAVLESVLADLSKSQRLNALLELDSWVEESPILDEIVKQTSEKVQLKCPRCPSIMSHAELIAHLWEVHRLRYGEGVVSDPTDYVGRTINEAAASGNPMLYDRAYLESYYFFPDAEPRLVFQALVARGANDAEQIELLLNLADEENAGVCSYCLSSVAVALPELLPPLSLRRGRISGEGYGIELLPTWLEAELRIEAPGTAVETLPMNDKPRRRRQIAGVVATTIAVLLLLGLLLIPMNATMDLAVGIVGCVIVGVSFALFTSRKKSIVDQEARLIDLAWQHLVPGIGRSDAATRFLLRLCRTSLDRGQPSRRQAALDEVIEQTSFLVQRRAIFAQLNAMAKFVKLIDWSQPGPDRYQAVFSEMTQLFREKRSLASLETMAGVILNERIIMPSERPLLARVAMAAAFESGFRPADLMMFFRFGPRFTELCTPIDRDGLNLLFQLWRLERKSNIRLVSLFKLIEQEPRRARELLRETPGLLWIIPMPTHFPEALTRFQISRDGLVYDGKSICKDPETLLLKSKGEIVRCEIGSLAMNVPSSIAEELMNILHQHLTLRQELGKQETTQRLRPETVTMLQPMAVECPLCQSGALHQPGRMGTLWQAILNQQAEEIT